MDRACDYQCFDTCAVPRADRFDFWRTWYDQAVDVRMRLDPAGDTRTSPGRFTASAHVLTAGDLQIVEVTCGPADGSWARSATRVKNLVRLVLLAPTPGGTATWHTRQLRLDHGAAAILGRTAGAWHTPAGMHGIQVNLPRTLLDLPDNRIDRLLEHGPLPAVHPVLAGLAVPALAGMAGRLPALATIDPIGLQDTWAAITRMLLRALGGQDTAGADLAAARRARADQCIQAHLADPTLTPGRVAAMLGVSRRSLYAAFATDADRTPGSGVAARIRRHRMEAAARLLADPGTRRPVHTVAAMVGLPDPAHFSRLFHTAYGASPHDYQWAARAPAEPRQGATTGLGPDPVAQS